MLPCVFCVLDSKTCFSTNQTFSLQKPFSVQSLLFLMPFLAANLIKQCAVFTLNWIPLTDFPSTSLRAHCVTNSVLIVHLYLWFRHYDGIPHQGNLKLTVFFQVSNYGQKEMQELIKEPVRQDLRTWLQFLQLYLFSRSLQQQETQTKPSGKKIP